MKNDSFISKNKIKNIFQTGQDYEKRAILTEKRKRAEIVRVFPHAEAST